MRARYLTRLIIVILLAVLAVPLMLPVAAAAQSGYDVTFDVVHTTPVGATIRATINGSPGDMQVVVLDLADIRAGIAPDKCKQHEIKYSVISTVNEQTVTKSKPIMGLRDTTVNDLIYQVEGRIAEGEEMADVLDYLKTLNPDVKKSEIAEPISGIKGLGELDGKTTDTVTDKLAAVLESMPDQIEDVVDYEYYDVTQEVKTPLATVTKDLPQKSVSLKVQEPTVIEATVAVNEVTATGGYGSSGVLALIIDGVYYYDISNSSWWDAAWDYRNVLSFDAREIDEDLIDFPVGVFLTSDNFEFDLAKPDGSDIRFIDKDGVQSLSFEIVEWTYVGPDDPGNFAEIWVKVPKVDKNTPWSDYMFIYYGNSEATDASSPADVWDSNFKAVYHMNDSPDGLQVLDSTVNANHGTKNGCVEVEGLKGKAQSFDGVDDYIDCGNDASLDIDATITLETHVAFNGLDYVTSTGVNNNFLAKGIPDTDSGTPNAGYWVSFNNKDNKKSFTYTCFGNSAGGWYGGGNNFGAAIYDRQLTDQQYYNISVTISDLIGTLYIDGEQNADDKALNNLDLSAPTMPLLIGKASTSSSYRLRGAISEVRISNIARSASWIAATNATLRDEFLYYGSTDPVPTVSTLGATDIKSSMGHYSVTLHGRLDDINGAPYANVWFEYGLDESYGNATAKIIDVDTAPYEYSITVTDIEAGTWHFRAVGQNVDGTGVGLDMTFTIPHYLDRYTGMQHFLRLLPLILLCLSMLGVFGFTWIGIKAHGGDMAAISYFMGALLCVVVFTIMVTVLVTSIDSIF